MGCGYITYGNLDGVDEYSSMAEGQPEHVIFNVPVAKSDTLSRDGRIPFMSALSTRRQAFECTINAPGR